MIRLWTWQGIGFDITAGELDISQSQYTNLLPGYKAAVHRLCRELGVPSVVWCVSDPREHVVLAAQEEEEWQLEVPHSEILAVVNNLVWNQIIGRYNAFSIRAEIRWRQEAVEASNSASERRAYPARSPDDRLWEKKNLFIDDPYDELADVLLRFPVKKEHVVCPSA